MNRLLTAAVAAVALWTASCGGGGATINPPPPTGNYTLASLNGTYAFTTSGEVITGSSAIPMARVGSFTADGNGHISGGIEDVNTFGTPSTANAITGGSYTVNPDGRGTLTLSFANGNSINFGIVLTSTSDGLMIDETATTTQASTGSGNFILQQSTPFTLTELSGTYVFDFSGLDGAQPNPNPESFMGEFIANGGTGTIPSGIFDDNDGGTLTSNAAMTAGTIAQDPSQSASLTSFGRGIATIAGQNFVFYIVNANRVRFISTSNGMLSGDAVLQPSVPSSPSGSFAFLVAGASANGGFIRAARFDTCPQCANPGPTVSKLLMDVNNGGPENEFGPSALTMPSISYDSTTGRGQLSFQSSTLNVYSFVFYLSSASDGVIQEVSPNDTSPAFAVADGSILSQSGSPFTSSNITGPYAMNWSGLVTSGGQFANQDEEDLLAQETIKSLNLSGTYDLFQFTGLTLQTDRGSTGSITFNGDGTGSDGKSTSMIVNLSNASPIHMVVYIVNPQLAFFMNTNQSGAPRIVAGILKAQQ
ncbi:MAG TPA: hypothetical protein VJN89_03630 [Candidatus Acidoferrum sp.]|nr:hypothetical protein [Candidatus Acidoferrum sp.]